MRSKPYRCPKPEKRSWWSCGLVLLIGLPFGSALIAYGYAALWEAVTR